MSKLINEQNKLKKEKGSYDEEYQLNNIKL